uniref:Mitochondrial carrier protein n=1 Tax=Picea sitchensis TaxID=3332 RepID=D5AAX1_PICSI|nr:unknown [Picea sitchensis]
MVPFKSINFMTYDMYCNWLLKIPGKGEITNYDRLAAGAVSGITATMLSLPMDTIRTRLIAPGGEALGGVVGCFQHMVRTEGFFSLYKGLMPTLLSMAPASAVFYGVYDILKAAYLSSPKVQEQLRQRIRLERERQETLKADINTEENSDSRNQTEIGPIRTLLYGAIAGACAETVTYPLEVVRRHLQLQETTGLGLLATFTYMVKKDGARALFAGVLPSTMQVFNKSHLPDIVTEVLCKFFSANSTCDLNARFMT